MFSLVVKTSVIDSSTYVEGDIQTDANLKINGKVNGDIKVLNLELTKKAEVNGKITAFKAYINGQITGDVIANFISLGPNAKVMGNVEYHKINIAAGAAIDGQCKRHDENAHKLIEKK